MVRVHLSPPRYRKISRTFFRNLKTENTKRNKKRVNEKAKFLRIEKREETLKQNSGNKKLQESKNVECWRIQTKRNSESCKIKRGQATKGAGRMPWHWEPKKDAVSCEKLWGVASRHRSTDIRMEQSTKSHIFVSLYEQNSIRRGTA